LPDDLMNAEPNVLKQMVDLYHRQPSSIVAVQTVAREKTSSYGIVEGKAAGKRLYTLSGIVEKPSPAEAPSTLAVVGRYVFTPEIFPRLEKIRTGAGGEYQLTDGIADLMRNETVYAYEFIGQRYDCGDKLGYLQATVEYGLRHPELGSRFRDFLKKLKV
jgi:UTP--glucose-1-phosphate uridylyltransferase